MYRTYLDFRSLPIKVYRALRDALRYDIEADIRRKWVREEYCIRLGDECSLPILRGLIGRYLLHIYTR